MSVLVARFIKSNNPDIFNPPTAAGKRQASTILNACVIDDSPNTIKKINRTKYISDEISKSSFSDIFMDNLIDVLKDYYDDDDNNNSNCDIEYVANKRIDKNQFTNFDVKNIVCGVELAAQINDDLDPISSELILFVKQRINDSDENLKSAFFDYTFERKLKMLKIIMHNPADCFYDIKANGLCSWLLLIFIYLYYKKNKKNKTNYDYMNCKDINLNSRQQRNGFIGIIETMLKPLARAKNDDAYISIIFNKWEQLKDFISEKKGDSDDSNTYDNTSYPRSSWLSNGEIAEIALANSLPLALFGEEEGDVDCKRAVLKAVVHKREDGNFRQTHTVYSLLQVQAVLELPFRCYLINDHFYHDMKIARDVTTDISVIGSLYDKLCNQMLVWIKENIKSDAVVAKEEIEPEYFDCAAMSSDNINTSPISELFTEKDVNVLATIDSGVCGDEAVADPDKCNEMVVCCNEAERTGVDMEVVVETNFESGTAEVSVDEVVNSVDEVNSCDEVVKEVNQTISRINILAASETRNLSQTESLFDLKYFENVYNKFVELGLNKNKTWKNVPENKLNEDMDPKYIWPVVVKILNSKQNAEVSSKAYVALDLNSGCGIMSVCMLALILNYRVVGFECSLNAHRNSKLNQMEFLKMEPIQGSNELGDNIFNIWRKIRFFKNSTNKEQSELNSVVDILGNNPLNVHLIYFLSKNWSTKQRQFILMYMNKCINLAHIITDLTAVDVKNFYKGSYNTLHTSLVIHY